jgi:hypothetical protein
LANFSSICYNISPDTFIDLVGLGSISRHSANCSDKIDNSSSSLQTYSMFDDEDCYNGFHANRSPIEGSWTTEMRRLPAPTIISVQRIKSCNTVKPSSSLLYKKMRHVRPNSSLLTTLLCLMQTKGTSYCTDVPHNEPAKRHTTHALFSCTIAGIPGDYGCRRREKENKEKEKNEEKT